MLAFPSKFRIARLRKRGLQVGINCSISPTVTFDSTNCNLIKIGNNVTIAGDTIIIAHDASTRRLLGYTKKGSVKIGNNCFIGARVLILPNVSIGDFVIVGAGSVVVNDIPGYSVACGVPATVLETLEEYMGKNKQSTIETKNTKANV